jgi:hypothetical protein
LDRASAEEMEEEEEEEELRWGEFENGVAACDETSGSEGGCERANSAPMRRSWWWWWWKRKGGRREEEEVKKKRNEKKKRSKRQEFAPSRRFEKKKKNQKNQSKCRLQRPLHPLSASSSGSRHRPKLLPRQNRERKAVPARERQLERGKEGRKEAAARSNEGR